MALITLTELHPDPIRDKMTGIIPFSLERKPIKFLEETTPFVIDHTNLQQIRVCMDDNRVTQIVTKNSTWVYVQESVDQITKMIEEKEKESAN